MAIVAMEIDTNAFSAIRGPQQKAAGPSNPGSVYCSTMEPCSKRRVRLIPAVSTHEARALIVEEAHTQQLKSRLQCPSDALVLQ
jgi:hypothetical protein